MNILFFTMTAGLILAVFFLCRSFKTRGKLEQQNENFEKTQTIIKKQMDVASRPNLSDSDILDRLHNDDF